MSPNPFAPSPITPSRVSPGAGSPGAGPTRSDGPASDPSPVDAGHPGRRRLGPPAMLGMAMMLAIGWHALLWPALPSPGVVWVLLTLLYLAVADEVLAGTGPDGRPPAYPGTGWPVLLAMATAIGFHGGLVAAAVAVLLHGVLLVVRNRSSGWNGVGQVGTTWFVELPAVALLVAIQAFPGLAPHPGLVLLAGAAAGLTVEVLARWLVPHLDVSAVVWRPARRCRSVEPAAVGATAALLGLTVATGPGWIIVPVMVALAVLALVERGEMRRHAVQSGVVDSLLMALEAKDLYTRGHAVRVAEWTALIADEMGLTAERTRRVVMAALLHDIGKIVTPRHLLRKPGRLTPDEYRRVQQHAGAAESVLRHIEFLQPVTGIVTEHHWHLDGTGYGAAAGSGPSLEARIVAVADAFDAMTSHRPYRTALSRTYAIEELRIHAGTQFDTEVVEALVTRLSDLPQPRFSDGAESDWAARRTAESTAGR